MQWSIIFNQCELLLWSWLHNLCYLLWYQGVINCTSKGGAYLKKNIDSSSPIKPIGQNWEKDLSQLHKLLESLINEIMLHWFTGLHQQRVYTSSGASFSWLHQRDNNRYSWGRIPKLVYILCRCKPVDWVWVKRHRSCECHRMKMSIRSTGSIFTVIYDWVSQN